MLIQTINGKYPKSQALICKRSLCSLHQKREEKINNMPHSKTNRRDKQHVTDMQMLVALIRKGGQ
jgi:hypothetical protein